MKYPKRSQYKYAKSRYRIRNWPEYESGLRNRGDLTVWLSDAALDAWQAPASGKPGGQRTYSDLAIEAALTIRMISTSPRAPRKLHPHGFSELYESLGAGRRSLDLIVPGLTGRQERHLEPSGDQSPALGA